MVPRVAMSAAKAEAVWTKMTGQIEVVRHRSAA
jgi:hypothetical protein